MWGEEGGEKKERKKKKKKKKHTHTHQKDTMLNVWTRKLMIEWLS